MLTLPLMLALFGEIVEIQTDQLWTKQEIVYSVPNDPSLKTWDLIWAFPFRISNGGEIYITVHRCERTDVASIYVKEDLYYRLLKQIRAGQSWIKEPTAVWYTPGEDTKNWYKFIHITQVHPGTGHFLTEYVFVVERKRLRKVIFVRAPETLKGIIGESQGMWKGEGNTFARDEITFGTSVYNEHDGNCCPSGGTITGTYKVFKEHRGETEIQTSTTGDEWEIPIESVIIEMDSYEWDPTDNPR